MNSLTDHASLKAYYEQHKNNYPEAFRLRIHRALSWLNKAEQLARAKDSDMQFISLWISFNALYAREINGEQLSESETFNYFFEQLYALDQEKSLYHLVWRKFPGAIRIFMDNDYVFQPFWEYQNGRISEKDYLKANIIHRERFYSAIERQHTANLLALIFQRLYTLRNQLVHGGATYHSAANRAQILDACTILHSLIPAQLAVMMKNPLALDWGDPFYPYLETR